MIMLEPRLYIFALLRGYVSVLVSLGDGQKLFNGTRAIAGMTLDLHPKTGFRVTFLEVEFIAQNARGQEPAPVTV